jgi:hypothetical protein
MLLMTQMARVQPTHSMHNRELFKYFPLQTVIIVILGLGTPPPHLTSHIELKLNLLLTSWALGEEQKEG